MRPDTCWDQTSAVADTVAVAPEAGTCPSVSDTVALVAPVAYAGAWSQSQADPSDVAALVVQEFAAW